MDALLLPGFVVVLGLWGYWYHSLLNFPSFQVHRRMHFLLGVMPAICMLVLLMVLLRRASPDVRSDGEAILFYALAGTIWLRLGLLLLALAGYSMRQDVLERGNRAAAWTICGALIGITFCFCGANIGRGPGPQVVFFCAALATIAFFASLYLLEIISRVTDRITIERNEETGMRTGAWCVAVGLILGSAVAGDWKSVGATLRDLARFGWVVILWLAVASCIELYLRRQSENQISRRTFSVAVAAVYLAGAGAYVSWLSAR